MAELLMIQLIFPACFRGLLMTLIFDLWL